MKNSVIVVGGGVMGASAAYWLSTLGRQVTLLDQNEVPNRHGASGDQLRALRLAYGKDVFYADMAAKSLPLWLDFCRQSADPFLLQNGFMDLAVQEHGYEEHCLKVLRELKSPCVVLGKDELRRHYPMINTRAVRYGLLHKAGGMIWAMRALSAVLNLAQRRGVKVKAHAKIVAVQRSGGEIKGLKDSTGKTWSAEQYLFAPGAWVQEIFRGWRIPVEAIRRRQLYLCPPINRGRYRPEHFPPFSIASQGFCGYPLHIHGFMKIAESRRGTVVKVPGNAGEEAEPAFEKKCRAFLKKFLPELADFNEFEGHVAYYSATKDGDFIIDRLPGAANGFLMAGFGDQGFTFAPLLGRAAAQVLVGGKSDINLHRFRLARF